MRTSDAAVPARVAPDLSDLTHPTDSTGSADEGAARAQCTLIVSDIHLSAQQPRTVEAFLRFVAATPARVARLVILGDLFEYWAGDDDLDTPLHRRISAAFRGVVEAGCALAIMRGNRDFLIGAAAAAAWGATLLDDPVPLAPGSDILLSHGDALCTDDLEYMAFRAQVRAPAWQQAFLARPLVERKSIIADLRAQSEAGKGVKSMAIMDVAPEAVRALLERSGATLLIHGHTHRPARHVLKVDGRNCRRVVLPDWDFDGPVERGGGILVRGTQGSAEIETIAADAP